MVHGESLLGTVGTARLALAEAGSEAARPLSVSIGQWSAQFAGLEAAIGHQDDRVSNLIVNFRGGLAEIEGQLGTLGDTGEAQTRQLSEAIARKRGELDAMTAPLRANDEETINRKSNRLNSSH